MANKPSNKKTQKNILKSKATSKLKVEAIPSEPPIIKEQEEAPLFTRRNKLVIFAIITLFSFGIYLNTIPNLYCLDDGIVVTNNAFTKNGIYGLKDIFQYDTMAGRFGKDVNYLQGGRYRPLSVALFAIEYEYFHENPHISHAVNILLYALTGIFIFLVLSKLFISPSLRPLEQKWYFSIPFLATILFIAHPIHTEAVSNIKSRDEIMTMLGSFVALWFILKSFEKKRIIYLFFASIAFFAALLSKENAITFLAIIPLAIWFFANKSLKTNLISFIPLLVASTAFLYIRYKVIGFNISNVPKELLNNPFLEATVSQKFATIFYTLWLYIKLLIIPHPLTWDYYPHHIQLINWKDARAFLPFSLYLALGIYGLFSLRKKNNVLGFSVLFFLASMSIVSNIVFPVGVFMSERFVFISSLAFTLTLAFFLVVKVPDLLKKLKISIQSYKLVLVLFLFTVLSLYSFKTIERNFDWKDNFTLVTHDVEISRNSIMGMKTTGGEYVEKALRTSDSLLSLSYVKKGKEYLLKAVKTHPNYVDGMLDLGIVYGKYDKNIDSCLYFSSEVIRLDPNNSKAFNNIAMLFKEKENQALMLKTYKKLYEYNPNRLEVNTILGWLYSSNRDYKNAIFYLEKAINLDNNQSDLYLNLGVAYGNSGDFNKAVLAFEAAQRLNPKNPLIYSNLAESFKILKQPEKEKATRAKLQALQADLQKAKK